MMYRYFTHIPPCTREYDEEYWVVSLFSASRTKENIHAKQFIIFVEGLKIDDNDLHHCFIRYYEITFIPGQLPQLGIRESASINSDEQYYNRRYLPQHYSPFSVFRGNWHIECEGVAAMMAAIEEDQKKLQTAAAGKWYAQNVTASHSIETTFVNPSRSGTNSYPTTPPRSPINDHRPLSSQPISDSSAPHMISPHPSKQLTGYHTPVSMSPNPSPPASPLSVLAINSEENLRRWVKGKLEIAGIVKNDCLYNHLTHDDRCPWQMMVTI